MTTQTSNPKKILVLGATSAIAEAVCRIWAAQGAALFLVARNRQKLDQVAADLKVRGAVWLDTAVADLDDTAAHPSLLAHAVNSLGGLDIAFLAHGVLGDQSRAESDYEYTEQILQTNLLSPISLLTWLGNFFAQRRSGSIAVLSSIAGERGRRIIYVYGASKAGLSVFLGGLRNRLDREGVHILTIKPGRVKTPMTQGMKGFERFADPDKVAAEIVRAINTRKDELYTPWIWRPIMFIVRHIPESIFKKLNF